MKCRVLRAQKHDAVYTREDGFLAVLPNASISGSSFIASGRLSIFEGFRVCKGWAVLPMRAQRATIVTEAWSVTQNPATEESSTRKRCDPNAAETCMRLGSNPTAATRKSL